MIKFDTKHKVWKCIYSHQKLWCEGPFSAISQENIQLDDLPFGQLHCLFALAFSTFKFCNFGRSNHCISESLCYTQTALFSFQIDFLLQILAHGNYRRDNIHSTTLPMIWDINRPSFFRSFSYFISFCSLVSILCSSIQILEIKGFTSVLTQNKNLRTLNITK